MDYVEIVVVAVGVSLAKGFREISKRVRSREWRRRPAVKVLLKDISVCILREHQAFNARLE